MEDIRQLQFKQTICYSAALDDSTTRDLLFLLPYDMQIGPETMSFSSQQSIPYAEQKYSLTCRSYAHGLFACLKYLH